MGRHRLLQLRALYGGRHLRTTLILAVASAAAGGLTGAVGFGVASAPAGHGQPAPVTHSPTPKHHHPRATTAPTTHPIRTSPKHTKSPSPTATPSSVPTGATSPSQSPTPPPTPTGAPTSPAPSGSASPPPGGASPPG